MANTGYKRRQRKGFYVTLKDIRCDCGNPATRQVQVSQLRANGNELANVLPLCDDCYALMLDEERAYRRRVGGQVALMGVT
jgi:hypothetical protein